MEFHYERFVRQRITRAKKVFVFLMFFVLFLVMMFVGIASFLFGLALVGLALIAGMAYGFYFYLTRLAVEYEYQLTGSRSSIDLDIAKIYSAKKRKELLSLNCREFEIVARVGGPKYSEAYRKLPVVYKCVKSMDEEDLFFIVTNTKDGRTIIYIQLNDNMLEGLMKNIPSKVFK